MFSSSPFGGFFEVTTVVTAVDAGGKVDVLGLLEDLFASGGAVVISTSPYMSKKEW